MNAKLPELQAAADAFFPDPVEIVFSEVSRNDERLPAPVMASKVWNHVAFLARRDSRWAAAVCSPPVCRECSRRVLSYWAPGWWGKMPRVSPLRWG